MASKKDPNNSLPQAAENDATPSAKITYANEVIAIIAGLAANEVEGIAGMCSISGNYLNKNRNVTKGVKVELGTEEAAVDLFVIVEYGTPIQRAAMDAQENVRKAIESMTGLHVVRVDVHVQGVSFEKENKALQSGVESAALEAGETAPEKLTEPETEQPAEEKPEEEKKPAKQSRTKNSKSKKEKPENPEDDHSPKEA
ncbi:MAG: Asp23/Gls24 family envelope stress response protein [Clostridia bacterium]|nr:Asp23/Gls24 family envelope stress response protein [Clostridia bacterium]